MEMNDILKLVVNAAEDKKAEKVEVIEISDISSIGDYFVIANGDNVNQVHAISQNIEEAMDKINRKPLSIEGYSGGNWILMDYGDIIIHIFDTETRNYYNIERIWKDGKRIDKDAL